MAFPNSSGTAAPRLEPPAHACDSHIHIYDPRFPMAAPDRRAVDHASVGDYRRLQARLGTSRVVIVQPAAYGTDNRVTLDAIAQLGIANARGVAVVHPDVTDAQLRSMHGAGIRGLRFTQHDPKTAVTTAEMIEPLAVRVNALGWHVQLHLLAERIVELAAIIERLPGTIVFDHLLRLPPPAPLAHPAWDFVKRLLDRGRTWVKLSGAYLNTSAPDDYAETLPIARALVAHAPERMVWGSDWPHPTQRHVKPDDAALFDLLQDWAPDAAARERILVRNPAQLYGF